MFGYAAFAQSSFAALGSSAYVVSISEPISVVTDSYVIFVDFKSAISEGMTLADSSSKVYGINENITENATFADLPDSVKGMFETAAEPITMLDFASYTGWFIINDNQTITWYAVDNSQSVTWQNIGNNQTPNWVVINNTQG